MRHRKIKPSRVETPRPSGSCPRPPRSGDSLAALIHRYQREYAAPHRTLLNGYRASNNLAKAIENAIGSTGKVPDHQRRVGRTILKKAGSALLAKELQIKACTSGKYSVNGRCFDIGIATRRALSKFLESENALTSGDASERASGNGSIMRLAPVPVRYADLYPNKIEEISKLAEESSLPTHASEQCLSACRYLATVLAALMHGEDRDKILSPDWMPLRHLNEIKPLHPLIQDVAQGSFQQRQPPEIQGSGWVVKSLEASLWAFHDADTFEEAVLKAVNLGDDADTTGAICGQLAGAYWGESNIAGSLRSGLAGFDMIEAAIAGIVGS